MSLDAKELRASMLDAAQKVLPSGSTAAKACLRQVIDSDLATFNELANARLLGEIDDEFLAQQLSDEKEIIASTLLSCDGIDAGTAKSVANAAIDALDAAIKAGVETLYAPASAKRAAKKNSAAPKKLSLKDRRLNARPDAADFRDLMYVPTLVEVGEERLLEDYLKHKVPILNQGREGACTGYALATVAHFLLRSRRTKPNLTPVSPRMLYAMARRYDEWPGESYDWSSCRGAMKGWHKHGVCDHDLWKHDPAKPDFSLTEERAKDGLDRPLGAYFRVNHKDLIAMHAAITEVGVLYASADVHAGWDSASTTTGRIPYDPKSVAPDGHAFAIVAYDKTGFWIQNSWGKTWGKDGFGHMSYDDWLCNGNDVWVARLGVPTTINATSTSSSRTFSVSAQARAFAFEDVRPHVVSLGNDGRLRTTGNMGASEAQLRTVIQQDLPEKTKNWSKRRIVLYAHGGLVGEEGAVQRVNDYRQAMMNAECYPLAFIWHSDYWSTITNILTEAFRQRKPEGHIGGVKDFMLDRLDDALEPIGRGATGKASWDEMKENALAAAASPTGGAAFVASELAALATRFKNVEIHVVGHSAGSIFHAPLIRLLTQTLGMKIESLTLWAPACTMTLFDQYYMPIFNSGGIKRFNLYTLTDRAERDDNCAKIYNKSLLYLVSNAFEKRARIPVFRPVGEPILGMEYFAKEHAGLKALIKSGVADWILSPNAKPEGDIDGSASTSHGGFDDDKATVLATLARILGKKSAGAGAEKNLSFASGASRNRNNRDFLSEIDTRKANTF